MRPTFSTLAAIAAMNALIALAASPYAGHESRDLKALTEAEVADYLEGKGMGFAKPAELNGYPGPMHVMEMADALQLSAAQREATRELLYRHKSEVKALGARLIEAERALERLFRERAASAESVAAATARAAELQGRIRGAHLLTHLEQARLLEPAQVKRYGELRGYAQRPDGQPHRHH
jgi:hypothetical protein